ncbi:AMP-binding protein [Bosea sp. 2KB_26]|uniref:AMP-binding protein n=1 Tax=Bosea sp. 2KB_26 TaxID=3237475 RepID=UPI003F93BECB
MSVQQLPSDLFGCADTLPEALSRALRLAPSDEAVVCNGERISYAALAARVDVVAAALVAHGMRKGDHVGICVGNGIPWIVLFHAIARLGAVVVPVNTRLKAEEIAYTLRQSDVSLLFVADKLLKVDFIEILRQICPAIDVTLPDAALPQLSSVVVLGETVPAGAIGFADFLTPAAGKPGPEPACDADDPLLIQYTSGTTSFPKGATLTHRNMLWDAYSAGRFFGLRSGERYFSPRPFFHVAGSTLAIVASLQHLACLVSCERYEPGDALRLMEEERCTLMSGNDTIFLMLLDHPDLPKRKLVLRGGWAAATPSVMERIARQLGATETVVCYGQSEASPNVCASAWWDPLEDRIAGLMRIHPGVEVEIRATEDEPAPGPGEVGEIYVRGWNVMKGYYAKPEETRAALGEDGWLRTGDLGRLLPDGRMAFVGRAKDIIRVGGENVALADIENVLHRHPGIQQAQVVGVPDKRLMEVPAAFVILAGGTALAPDEIIAWSKEHLAGFKVPRYVQIVDSFDLIGMTASSKIQKNKLAAHAVRVFGLEAVA